MDTPKPNLSFPDFPVIPITRLPFFKLWLVWCLFIVLIWSGVITGGFFAGRAVYRHFHNAKTPSSITVTVSP